MAEVGQRKVVTVLFSDLVDSTSMAESMDPEVMAELLNDYFTQMRSIIERHGGSVEKFIGDAVVGLFGVPSTHEDDALRAIHAALDMQQAINEVNDDVERRHRVRLAARIGINTGPVAVTGAGGGAAGMALGHVMNMAARLEQAAPAGHILIGQQTHDVAAAVLEVEPLAPLDVKGSSAPLAAWRVIGIADAAQSGWEGEGLFVGREQEIAAIESGFATAVRESACVVVNVVAPPGMGKSRLAAEATRRISASGRALVLIGRCVPYGEGATYAPLREMLGQVSLPMDTVEVERAVRSLSDTSLASPEETAWAMKLILQGLANEQPVLMVVDDLHWAEPHLLSLLDYVATLSVDSPLLMLCLARPDLFDTHPEWAAPRRHAVTVRLEPLTSAETEALLASNEALAADPQQMQKVVDAAAGVPLFIEQMAAALRSEGEGGIPAGVRALLAARVDRLQSSERTLLERAAIQGEVFDMATVAALLGEHSEFSVGGTLMGLVRREFIRPERGGDRFRFSHALLRDAVYEQMAHRLRSQLHEQFADLASSKNDDPEVIAHHLGRAHEERSVMGASDPETAALAKLAGVALHHAGRRAMARKEWRHGRDLLERARALLADNPALGVGVLIELIQAYGELADWEAASGAYAAAVQAAQSIGDESIRLRVEMAWAQIQARRGDERDHAGIGSIAERAVEHFSSSGQEADLARALVLKAFMPASGDIAESVRLLRQAQVVAERAGDEWTQIDIWDELGGAMLFGPTPYEEIHDFVLREIEWARQRGIPFNEADGQLGEAYVLAAAGNIDEARRAVAGVHELFVQLPGFVSQLGECDILAASIELDAGDSMAAESFYRHGLETLEQAKHALWWRTTAIGLANLLADLGGRDEEARALLDEVDRRGLSWGARPHSWYLQARAKLAISNGDAEVALRLAREAVEVLANVQSLQNEARAHETLGDLLAQAGDAAGSTLALTKARDLYAAKGYQPGVRRVSNKLSGAT